MTSTFAGCTVVNSGWMTQKLQTSVSFDEAPPPAGGPMKANVTSAPLPGLQLPWRGRGDG